METIVSEWQLQSLGVAVALLILILLVSSVTSLFVAFLSYFVGKNFVQRYSGGSEDQAQKADLRRLVIQGVLVGLIGGLSGQLGGASRESAVGDVLPAILAIIGGYSAYLLGEKKAGSTTFYSNGFCFLITFFLMYNLSSLLRQSNEAFAFCKEVYSNAEFAVGEAKASRDQTWGIYCSDVFSEWTKLPSPADP